jgi:hypothetical protein
VLSGCKCTQSEEISLQETEFTPVQAAPVESAASTEVVAEPVKQASPKAVAGVKDAPKVIDLYSDLAIQNAIITQHTVYPYHFVNNSAVLNPLGQRDLAVLARHFAQNPGELNVRRGDVDPALYQSRMETVKARLAEGGVDVSRIRMYDGLAGGEGMPTSEIIEVLARSRDPLTNTGSSDSYGESSYTMQP